MSGWCSARLCAWLSIAAITAAPVPVRADGRNAPTVATATPIQHVVVIFQENVSFDHYFATYPNAANPSGETPFQVRSDTRSVNNLAAAGLLTDNPNSVNPFRLSPADAVTCDQNHDYGAEQKAFDAGLMDKFPEDTGSGGPGCNDLGLGTGVVMGYFDGNTTTA